MRRSAARTSRARRKLRRTRALPIQADDFEGDGAVVTLEAALDFDELLERAHGEGTDVVVVFSTSRCGPCKLLYPTVARASTERWAEGAEFVRVVADTNDETRKLAQRYQVTQVPALRLIRDGAVQKEWLGTSPQALRQQLYLWLDA